MDYQIFILLCAVTIILNLPSSWTYVCSKVQSTRTVNGFFYYTNYFCCNDYHQVDGHCTECGPGFTSKEGSNCTPCKNPLYGRKCADICSCKDFERCDNVYGCVSNQDEQYQTTSALNVTWFISEQDIQKVTDIENKANETTQGVNKAIGMENSTQLTEAAQLSSTTISTSDNEQISDILGLTRREFIIYSAGVGGFLLVFALSFSLFFIRKTTKNKKNLQKGNGNRQTHDVVCNELQEGLYEEIDERLLCNTKPQNENDVTAYIDVIDERSAL